MQAHTQNVQAGTKSRCYRGKIETTDELEVGDDKDSRKTKHLRKKKVAQRKRTRDLYYNLDPLVPVCKRSPFAEKGCLPSGRTFLQLSNDTVDHLRKLKEERDGVSRGKVRGVEDVQFKQLPNETDKQKRSPEGDQDMTKETRAVQGLAGARHAQVALGGVWALHGGFSEGMLSSSQMLLLELDTTRLTVLRVSEGLRRLFRHLPRDNNIVGECLLHYVDQSSATVLRSSTKKRSEPGKGNTFNMTLRTWQHHSIVIPMLFVVQRIGSHVPDTELFVLSPLESPLESDSSTLDHGWTIERMRDLCGVYELDASKSTHPPWYTEEVMNSLEPQDAQVGWVNASINSLLSSDSSRLTIQNVAGPLGINPFHANSWTGQLKSISMKLTQLHLTFDMKSDMVSMCSMHVRFKLPKIAGELRTPWMKLACFQLDGTASSLLGASTSSKQIRMFAMHSPDGLRILVMHFRISQATRSAAAHAHSTDPTHVVSMQCCHSRELEISSQGFISKGDLLNSANEPIMTFVEHYSKTENADRALISSMLLEEDDSDQPAAAAAAAATSSAAGGRMHRKAAHSSNGGKAALTLADVSGAATAAAGRAGGGGFPAQRDGISLPPIYTKQESSQRGML
jgi:hypothetical protein